MQFLMIIWQSYGRFPNPRGAHDASMWLGRGKWRQWLTYMMVLVVIGGSLKCGMGRLLGESAGESIWGRTLQDGRYCSRRDIPIETVTSARYFEDPGQLNSYTPLWFNTNLLHQLSDFKGYGQHAGHAWRVNRVGNTQVFECHSYWEPWQSLLRNRVWGSHTGMCMNC